MLPILNLFNKKNIFFVSIFQFFYGASELFFSFITGLALAIFVKGEDSIFFSKSLDVRSILFILILAIIIRYLFGYLSIKFTTSIVFSQWNLIIERFYFVVRNGGINLNQISKLSSMISHDCHITFNNFYINIFTLIGEILLLVMGVIVLSLISPLATIYTFVLLFIFGTAYYKYFFYLNSKVGYKFKFFLDEVIDKFRSFLSFRDMKWLREDEKEMANEIHINSRKYMKYATNKLMLDAMNRTSIETFGFIMLASFPFAVTFISRDLIDTQELVLTLVVWIKILATLYKITSKAQNCSFNYSYAKDLIKYINKSESFKDYIQKGFSELDSFAKNKRIRKLNKKNLLEIESFFVKDLNGFKFTFPRMEIDRGKRYLLMGPSGSGKSTLIKQILYMPSLKHYLPGVKSRIFTSRISYISNEHELSFGGVLDILDEATYNQNKLKINKLLYDLKLDEKIENYKAFKKVKMELLSSGQKIRVRLLCEILYKPDLIIIDEAFSSLDRKTLVSSFGAIDKKTALLVIDHSNDFKYLFNDIVEYKIDKDIININ